MNIKLHHHALPLIALALALFGIVFITLNQYQTGGSIIPRGLVTQVVEIKPTANGLGKVSLNDELQPVEKPSPLQSVSQTGQSAQFNFQLPQ